MRGQPLFIHLYLAKHTVIIGSGVSGLSAAWALLRRGDRVTLIEQGEPSAESSWAGGGILAPLLPWQYSQPVVELALAAMRRYGDWIADIEAYSGLEAEYWVCGMQVSGIVESHEVLLKWCQQAGLNAAVCNSPTGNDLWLPDIAQVRNPRLGAALRSAISLAGGTILANCSIKALLSTTDRIMRIETSAGAFDLDRLLIATGAWSGLALAGLSAVPNIRPIRGQMLLFKFEPGLLDRIVYRQGLYLIPRRDGHILAGSTLEDAGFDKSTDLATRHRLHTEASALLPQLALAEPIRHWSGLRPGAPDNVPVISRHPAYSNVYVNVGHYRYGVTMAPASAELLADLMEDKTPTLDPAPYSWAAAEQRRWTNRL